MNTILLANLILLCKMGRPELWQRWNWLLKVHDRGLVPCTIMELQDALAADFNRNGDSK